MISSVSVIWVLEYSIPALLPLDESTDTVLTNFPKIKRYLNIQKQNKWNMKLIDPSIFQWHIFIGIVSRRLKNVVSNSALSVVILLMNLIRPHKYARIFTSKDYTHEQNRLRTNIAWTQNFWRRNICQINRAEFNFFRYELCLCVCLCKHKFANYYRYSIVVYQIRILV